MLHNIQRLQCGSQMDNIRKFQRKVLAFVCDSTINLPLEDVAVYQQHLGNEEGKWLWGKRTTKIKSGGTLLKALEDIVSYVKDHPANGPSILHAMDHDVQFDTQAANTSFQFEYHTVLDAAAHDVLRPLMTAFYTDFLANGFPSSIHHGPAENFDRESVLKAYRDANPKMEVCPACDGPHSDKIVDKQYDDADHYLPKSLYPFLSVHSANLVPVCLQCNRTFKGDRDPAEPPKTRDQPINDDPISDHANSPLTNAFFPYTTPAGADQIEVYVWRDAHAEAKLEIRPLPGMPPQRVSSLNRVFRLQDRWQDHLHHEISRIRNEIADVGRQHALFGWRVAPDKFPELIAQMLETRLSRIRSEYYCVVHTAYLHYILRDPPEMDELFLQYENR